MKILIFENIYSSKESTKIELNTFLHTTDPIIIWQLHLKNVKQYINRNNISYFGEILFLLPLHDKNLISATAPFVLTEGTFPGDNSGY
jgi:hypothetical protein